MAKFIVRNLCNGTDLASYSDSVSALKALNGFCKKFNKNLDHYMVLKRVLVEGEYHEEVITELE